MSVYYNDSDPSRLSQPMTGASLRASGDDWTVDLCVLYLITNVVNDKKYVGITTQGIRKRWMQHAQPSQRNNRALYGAIRKYGEDSFTVELLAVAFTWETLCVLEVAVIAWFNTKVQHGYNMTNGGDGVYGLPREVVEATAAKNRGRHHTEEARKRIGEAGRTRQMSDRTKALIGEKHRGKVLTSEHRAKLSLAKTGKKLPLRSAEHCKKISEGLVRAHARRRGE